MHARIIQRVERTTKNREEVKLRKEVAMENMKKCRERRESRDL
jgi:hypothetical protein